MPERKARIHKLLQECTNELYAYIKESESTPDRWVPAAKIKNDLELNFPSVPIANTQYGDRGWLFAILARMLEDRGRIEYKKEGSKAFYRTIAKPLE